MQRRIPDGPKSPVLARRTSLRRRTAGKKRMDTIGASLCALACVGSIVEMACSSPITPEISSTCTESNIATKTSAAYQEEDCENDGCRDHK